LIHKKKNNDHGQTRESGVSTISKQVVEAENKRKREESKGLASLRAHLSNSKAFASQGNFFEDNLKFNLILILSSIHKNPLIN
jgi:hypothetical protein